MSQNDDLFLQKRKHPILYFRVYNANTPKNAVYAALTPALHLTTFFEVILRIPTAPRAFFSGGGFPLGKPILQAVVHGIHFQNGMQSQM